MAPLSERLQISACVTDQNRRDEGPDAVGAFPCRCKCICVFIHIKQTNKYTESNTNYMCVYTQANVYKLFMSLLS